MGRTVSDAPGCAPDGEYDPSIEDFISKERSYTHFDLALTEKQRTGIKFTDREIETHSFWPLLGYEDVERRAKRLADGSVKFEEKVREIKFGSHGDAALLEWYCHALSKKYDSFLSSKAFAPSVLAYRSGMGDNISQARGLFSEIVSRGSCVAIAIDIKGFFDHISHEVLLQSLKAVIGSAPLSAADFKIFQRMSKFEWVDSDKLRDRLGNRYGQGGRICTAPEFRKVVRSANENLVQVNRNAYGIPQGTPLSGIYANIL